MKSEENPNNSVTPSDSGATQPEGPLADAASQDSEQLDNSSLEKAAADLASAAADGATSMMNASSSSSPTTPDTTTPDTTGIDTSASLNETSGAPDGNALSNETSSAQTADLSSEQASGQTTEQVTEQATEQASKPSFGAVENPDLSDVTPPATLNNSAEDLSGEQPSNSLDTKIDDSASDTSSQTANSENDLSNDSSNNSTNSDDSLDTPSDATSSLNTETSEMTSASFIGEAPKTEDKKEDSEEDEPLVPADPVPGSIGSAIAYSEDAPNHSAPVAKKSKFQLFKKRNEEDDGSVEIGGKKIDSKRILIIVGIIVLVAVIAFVLFFVLGGSSQKKTTTKSSITTTPQSKESSLICKKEGGDTAFSKYPQVVSGSEEIIVMYKDGILVSFGDNLRLNYETTEIASVRLNEIRSDYTVMYNNLKFTTDPFESTFNVNGTSALVSHQADGNGINASNAKILGIPVLKGEVYSDVDSLQDNYESQGFTCTAK